MFSGKKKNMFILTKTIFCISSEEFQIIIAGIKPLYHTTVSS